MSMTAPGTSVADVMEIGERISKDILKLPYIATIGHQIGRAELGDAEDPVGRDPDRALVPGREELVVRHGQLSGAGSGAAGSCSRRTDSRSR